MNIVRHEQAPADREAMLAMRALVALQGERSFRREARPDFDAMISRTPFSEGVTYAAGTVGGVSGWWCRPANQLSEGVILHHHGGAYVLGSAAAYRAYVGQIATRAGMPAFAADYALAPERPFPAAPEDALAAYRGLVEDGHRRIALAGDSAGGGLTLSLLASASRRTDVPKPLGAMVMSPWCDLALTGGSMISRADADPLLTRKMLDEAATLYVGAGDRLEPAASPLHGDLTDLPPVLIHVGEDEILLDDALRYAERMQAVGGSAVVHVWAGMPHVFPANLGTLKAAGQALDIAGAFLAGLAG